MRKESKAQRKLTIFVASTVYGIQELLDRIYEGLTKKGFDVWMSYKGTVPVSPGKTNPELCLEAVERADCFVGILTGRSGSGKDKKMLSILNNEMKRAIDLDKPRWFIVDHDVQVARQALKPVLKEGAEFVSSVIIQDAEVIEMFDLIPAKQ